MFSTRIGGTVKRVEFILLGEPGMRVDGRSVDLGPAKQRCVLVLLLLDLGRSLTPDRLAAGLWGEATPQRATANLRSYVSRLRRSFPEGSGCQIRRDRGGYVLDADGAVVDLHEFRRLVERARTCEDAEAEPLLSGALRLWSGEALSGLEAPRLTEVRHELHAELLAARLDHNDVRLRLARTSDLLTELPGLVAEHPLDERLAAQFMLALYRGGRQADALRHYERVRTLLAEELGADPGPELRRLHQRILSSDPGLTEAVRAAPPPSSPVPRQLPAPPSRFTGRDEELAVLDEAHSGAAEADGGSVVTAICGPPGVGKTWLALHWAHRGGADHFPDGQLYADLDGFTPSKCPLPPEAVLRMFLEGLGVEPAAIPGDTAARTALYRSMTAGRRMLVVLDNARDSEQVAPLLPGGPGCHVVVTGRTAFAGLVRAHGARIVSLDVLGLEEAGRLFSRHVGASRTEAEPEAVAELLGHCSGLPLALGIVAARASMRTELRLAELATELRVRDDRLGALDAGEVTADLSAVFSCSYRALEPEAARMFRLLAFCPVPDVSAAGAASVFGVPVRQARPLLTKLLNAHLVTEGRYGRYALHDLLREYARGRALASDSAEERDAALHRLLGFLLHTARAADRLVGPQRPPTEPVAKVSGCSPLAFEDRAAAMSWFEAEHTALSAVQRAAVDRGWDTEVWHLAWATHVFHRRRGYVHDNVAMWRNALISAQRLGRPSLEADAHRYLGMALLRLDERVSGTAHLRRALALASRESAPADRAHIHLSLAEAHDRRAEPVLALVHAQEALDVYRGSGNTAREAQALNTVGWCQAGLGRLDEAGHSCERALSLAREHHPETEAAALDSLGHIAHRSGRLAEAAERYAASVAAFRRIGDSYDECKALLCLTEVLLTLERREEARSLLWEAFTRYRAQYRVIEAERVRNALAHV